MTYSDQNSKNCQVYMVSGTSAASIEYFVVNPCILKMANVAKELYFIGGWDIDAPVLCLASSKTVLKLIG